MPDPRGPARCRVPGEPMGEVVIHPPVNRAFVTAEHPEGELGWLGDALGRDFMVVRFVDGWMRMYSEEGKRNEDWYGWKADVRAPFNGIVTFVSEPMETNSPGSHSGGKASGIVFQRNDGVFVAYGHTRSIQVAEGDEVRAGQVVGKVGNDGTSWHPHLHVGAFADDRPLQVRVDLEALGRMLRALGEATFYGLDLGAA